MHFLYLMLMICTFPSFPQLMYFISFITYVLLTFPSLRMNFLHNVTYISPISPITYMSPISYISHITNCAFLHYVCISFITYILRCISFITYILRRISFITYMNTLRTFITYMNTLRTFPQLRTIPPFRTIPVYFRTIPVQFLRYVHFTHHVPHSLCSFLSRILTLSVICKFLTYLTSLRSRIIGFYFVIDIFS